MSVLFLYIYIFIYFYIYTYELDWSSSVDQFYFVILKVAQAQKVWAPLDNTFQGIIKLSDLVTVLCSVFVLEVKPGENNSG